MKNSNSKGKRQKANSRKKLYKATQRDQQAKCETPKEEWQKSGIAESLIKLNLKILTTDQIAEWFFQYLPHSARRNDGRIRDGYLRAYSNPLQGGWGIEGYDPTNLEGKPELRSRAKISFLFRNKE